MSKGAPRHSRKTVDGWRCHPSNRQDQRGCKNLDDVKGGLCRPSKFRRIPPEVEAGASLFLREILTNPLRKNRKEVEKTWQTSHKTQT